MEKIFIRRTMEEKQKKTNQRLKETALLFF